MLLFDTRKAPWQLPLTSQPQVPEASSHTAFSMAPAQSASPVAGEHVVSPSVMTSHEDPSAEAWRTQGRGSYDCPRDFPSVVKTHELIPKYQ